MKRKFFIFKCLLLGLSYAKQRGMSFEESMQEIVAHYREKIADAKHQLANIKERPFTTEDDPRDIKKLERIVAREQLLNSL